MNTVSSLSFYDSLNKLTCGFLVILPFFKNLQATCTRTLSYEIKTALFIILCYIIGIVFQNIVYLLLFKLRNSPSLIEVAKRKAIISPAKATISENEPILKRYYAAYYNVMRHNCLNNIPILEAHEAFLKNLFVLSILFSIYNFITTSYGIGICCLISTGVFAIIWYCTQTKIYQLIWEADYYLKHNV